MFASTFGFLIKSRLFALINVMDREGLGRATITLTGRSFKRLPFFWEVSLVILMCVWNRMKGLDQNASIKLERLSGVAVLFVSFSNVVFSEQYLRSGVEES